jgi:hypothetical protein
MQIIVYPGRVDYISTTQDWRLSVSQEMFIIIPIVTGGLTYASGRNLDNLASLIVAAKQDSIGRGINWEGV